jgi:DNA-binding NarL/FixJ family response regulator
MPDPIRIVLADDNYLVREGTRRLLEDSGEVVIAAAVGSAPQLLKAVAATGAEAVICDIRMPATALAGPAMEGIDAARGSWTRRSSRRSWHGGRACGSRRCPG